MEAHWSVYIVLCSDGTFYTGISDDVYARVAAHNRGTGALHTRSRRPVELVYREDNFQNRGAAAVREKAIKRLDQNEKRKLILAQKH